MINLDFLEYVIEFAKTENLTRTGEVLHISQSALTRAMQKIEEYVGVPLFERRGNKIGLTPAGRAFVGYAEAVVEAERNMVNATQAFYRASSQISVGLETISPIIRYGGALYAAFADKSIKSKMDTAENLIKGLENGTYDIAFVSRPIDTEEYDSVYVYSERLYVSVPKMHFVAGMTEGVGFVDIDRQSFLISNDLGIWESIIRENLPQSGFFYQSPEDMEDMINASTIPVFTTDMALPLKRSADRVDIPVIDDAASLDLYLVFRRSDGDRLQPLFKYLS